MNESIIAKDTLLILILTLTVIVTSHCAIIARATMREELKMRRTKLAIILFDRNLHMDMHTRRKSILHVAKYV